MARVFCNPGERVFPGCWSLAFDVEVVCASEVAEKEYFMADNCWDPARCEVYLASYRHWRWQIDHQSEVAFVHPHFVIIEQTAFFSGKVKGRILKE